MYALSSLLKSTVGLDGNLTVDPAKEMVTYGTQTDPTPKGDNNATVGLNTENSARNNPELRIQSIEDEFNKINGSTLEHDDDEDVTNVNKTKVVNNVTNQYVMGEGNNKQNNGMTNEDLQRQILEELRQANALAATTQGNVSKLADSYPERPYDVYSNHDGPKDRYKKNDFVVEMHSPRNRNSSQDSR